MGQVTRREFAEMCGCSDQTIYSNVRRGNLVLDGKKIDTDHPTNRNFLLQKERGGIKTNQALKSVKKIEKHTQTDRNPRKTKALFSKKEKQETPKKPKIKTKEEREAIRKAEMEIEFTLQKKELDREIAKEKLMTERVKRMKMEGELLPKDLVQNIFKTHIKNFQKTFHGASEQMIIDLGKTFGVETDKMSRGKDMLVKAINAASEKARQQTRNDLLNLVEEYSK